MMAVPQKDELSKVMNVEESHQFVPQYVGMDLLLKVRKNAMMEIRMI